jgi:hypothetical protein
MAIMCRARSSKPPTSLWPKRIGRPICQASSSACRSALATKASTALAQSAARSEIGVAAQAACAALAALKASSISPSPA